MIRAFVLLVAVGLLGPGQQPGAPAAAKPGTAKIVVDPAFGAETEWDVLFKSNDTWTAFSSDGSFFRPAAADGLVHKFDAAGKLIKTFGRKGQGPGDLQMPGALDVLEGKMLVVNDAGNRRLSLFDLDGNFLKTVKMGAIGGPSGSVLTLAALGGNKVACAVYEGLEGAPDVIAARYRVLIKDLEDGGETELTAFDWEKPRSKFMVRVIEWEPAVFLARTGPERVLVACSGTPEVAFFSFAGKKLSSFTLAIERTRITWKHLEFAVRADQDPKNIEFLARNKADIKLPEYLPLFLRLAVDAHGRILVYELNTARFSREATFKAYAADGRQTAAVRIDPAGYEPVMPVHFWKDWAYATLMKTGGDDSFVFARFKLVPAD
ncbi:MAG TPA: hypothetical protein VLJ16_14325 [Acidobacteriota bacterium]|nr:hypothetical protein [Acidobacteriota bacterium]